LVLPFYILTVFKFCNKNGLQTKFFAKKSVVFSAEVQNAMFVGSLGPLLNQVVALVHQVELNKWENYPSGKANKKIGLFQKNLVYNKLLY
jgi:hypothetical protein